MVVVDLMQARDVPPVCDGDLGEVLLARHAGGEDHQACGRPAVHLAEPVRRALRGMRETATAQASPDSCVVVLRSEEHTSELQSLMRTSYAGLCLTKKNTQQEQ